MRSAFTDCVNVDRLEKNLKKLRRIKRYACCVPCYTLRKIMEQIVKHKDRVMERLLSLSAEMCTFAKKGAWKALDRMAFDRNQLIEEIKSIDATIETFTPENVKRWTAQIHAAETMKQEVNDLIRKYQNHINTELKGLSEQKSIFLASAQIDPKGQTLSTRG